MNVIDFDDLQMKPLLHGLINQTILPFNESTMNISEGDMLGISFNDVPFKDYQLLVTNVSFTNLGKVKSNDVSRNGFIYRPAFLTFMKEVRNVVEEDSIVKLDFELMENRGCDDE